MTDDRRARWESEDAAGPRRDEEEAPDRRMISLIAVLVLGLMILGVLWAAGVLRKSSAIQDCVMAGRQNCAPIQSGGG